MYFPLRLHVSWDTMLADMLKKSWNIQRCFVHTFEQNSDSSKLDATVAFVFIITPCCHEVKIFTVVVEDKLYITGDVSRARSSHLPHRPEKKFNERSHSRSNPLTGVFTCFI